jgi:hypothetical protein
MSQAGLIALSLVELDSVSVPVSTAQPMTIATANTSPPRLQVFFMGISFGRRLSLG